MGYDDPPEAKGEKYTHRYHTHAHTWTYILPRNKREHQPVFNSVLIDERQSDP